MVEEENLKPLCFFDNRPEINFGLTAKVHFMN